MNLGGNRALEVFDGDAVSSVGQELSGTGGGGVGIGDPLPCGGIVVRSPPHVFSVDVARLRFSRDAGDRDRYQNGDREQDRSHRHVISLRVGIDRAMIHALSVETSHLSG